MGCCGDDNKDKYEEEDEEPTEWQKEEVKKGGKRNIILFKYVDVCTCIFKYMVELL